MEITDLDRAKRASVLLVSCLVKTLSERNTNFELRFIQTMELTAQNIRESTEDPEILQDIEVLDWTRDLLRRMGAGKGAYYLQEE